MLLGGVLAFVVVLLFLFRLYFKSRWQFPETTVPQPAQTGIFGHVPALLSYPFFDAAFHHNALQLGPLYSLNFPFPKKRVLYVTNDPDYIRDLVVNANPKKGPYSIKLFIGEGLVTSEGEQWKSDRKVMNVAFKRKFLRNLVPIMIRHAITLADHLAPSADTHQIVEVHEFLRKATVDIIGETILGKDFGYQNGKDTLLLTAMMKSMQGLHRKETSLLQKINVFGTWALKKNIKIVNSEAKKLVEEHIHTIQQSGHLSDPEYVPNTIMEVMIMSKSLSVDNICDQLKTFVFAGHDTTSSLLSFTLGAITQHPHIEKALYDELDSVMGDREIPTIEDVDELCKGTSLMRMLLKEVLRFYPPASSDRAIPKGTVIGEHVVEVDYAEALISPYCVHHNPKLWEDPEVFDPYRFTKERSKDRHPYAWIPFLVGPRNCIGQTFALMEATAILMVLLKRFRFRMAAGYVVKLCYQVTNGPGEQGMCMHIHNRA